MPRVFMVKKKRFKPRSKALDSAPDAGFEPATNGLTVHCSTAELIRIKKALYYFRRRFFCNMKDKKKRRLMAPLNVGEGWLSSPSPCRRRLA